jgi:hypothetical protein
MTAFTTIDSIEQFAYESSIADFMQPCLVCDNPTRMRIDALSMCSPFCWSKMMGYAPEQLHNPFSDTCECEHESHYVYF